MKLGFRWGVVLTITLLAGTVSAADVQVVPYGFILVNAGYNNHLATDIPVRVPLLTNLRDSSGSFLITARQTRLGLKLKIDSVKNWTASGQIEADFWGQKGSFGNGASTQSAPRLRLAFFALKKGTFQLLFGQDWVCFAPLNPNSLAHVSIPEFSSSGNLWNRLPQIRVDYTASMDNGNSVLVQVAAARPIAGDVTDDSQAEVLGAGEFGALPFGQARVAFSHAKVFTAGLSTHFGQSDWRKAYPAGGYTSDKTITFGVAGDIKVTSGIITFAVEGYTGSNLTMLFSNASTFDDPGDTLKKIEGVGAKGGWGEITIKPGGTQISFNGGAGIEILDGDQVGKTVTEAAKSKLWKNLTLFGAVMYDPLPKVTLALEVAFIKTTYKNLAGGVMKAKSGTNLNAGAGFRFSF